MTSPLAEAHRATRGLERKATAALLGATVAVSFSAILIRIAGGDAGTIVWLRMGLAAALLAPWAIRDVRRNTESFSRRRLGLIGLGGLLLTGHFLLWTASLRLTSISSSVLLVSMHPVIVAPLSRRLLGDAVTPRTLAGMTLALIGGAVTCLADLRVSQAAIAGDALALGGAVCLAGYLLIGRGVRAATTVAGYSAVVFGIVSAGAVLFTGVSGALHVPSLRTTLVCLALAVVCTIGGHAVYNWALRYVGALPVSIAFLGEPPLAAALGLVLLANVPSVSVVAGGVLILAGLGITLRSITASPHIRSALSLE